MILINEKIGHNKNPRWNVNLTNIFIRSSSRKEKRKTAIKVNTKLNTKLNTGNNKIKRITATSLYSKKLKNAIEKGLPKIKNISNKRVINL